MPSHTACGPPSRIGPLTHREKLSGGNRHYARGIAMTGPWGDMPRGRGVENAKTARLFTVSRLSAISPRTDFHGVGGPALLLFLFRVFHAV